MHPAARSQSVADIFDALFTEWSDGARIPADLAFQRYVRDRRFIGSTDRRALAALYYSIWRRFGVLSWGLEQADQPLSARNLVLAALKLDGTLEAQQAAFGQLPHTPEALDAEDEAWLATFDISAAPPAACANLPEAVHELIAARFGAETEAEMAALCEEAPLVLRANTLMTTQESLLSELRALGLEVGPTRFSPDGVRVQGRVATGNLAALTEGRAEIQDESSQLACRALAVRPGMRVIDLCAGAGGKTLALAALMQNPGEILAVDVNARKLQELERRAARAGARIIRTHLLDGPEGALPAGWEQVDAVLVDAPCSGLGTLRRNPDAAWRLSSDELESWIVTQAGLLRRAIACVKPGGRVVYATCSLLKEENEAQIIQVLNEKLTLSVVLAENMWDKAAPLREDPSVITTHGTSGPGMLLTPRHHETDGFYFAALHHQEG